MGMMDFFRSSYDLTPQFTNVPCQTKDIEEYGIGGTMTYFYLDPAGYLWCPDYTGTSTFEEIKEDDPRYDDKRLFLNFEWIPTGKRGKYRVHPITKYITIYPEQWEGSWETWPDCRIHFKDGKLQDFEILTKGDRNGN
jgi:hypothetical protein